MTILYVVLGVVGALALAVVALRMSGAAQLRAFQAAVSKYAASRGGSVEWISDRRFKVKGPLGEGEESATALRIMCPPGEEARWNTSIGFALRKYMADEFDDAFAKMAQKQLAKELPALESLSDEQLGQRLRAKIFHKRTGAEGLSTCAMSIDEKHEARVVLEGSELAGIPAAVRARLPGDDRQLLAQAIQASLPQAPDSAARSAPGHVWLLQPQTLFGDRPALVVGEGEQLSWLPAQPAPASADLAGLAGRSLGTGPLKGCMWLWTGQQLATIGVVQHTIIGPTTPDFTLMMKPDTAATLGLTLDARGSVGVSRAR